MNMQLEKSNKNRALFAPLIIKSTALMLIAMLSTLTGCGSDDKLPGGSNPGDQDPLSQGTPMFYIERQITEDADELTDPLRFVGGARLIKKARTVQSAPEENLTSRVCSRNCDLRDLDVSYDGQFLLFAMRLEDPDPNDDEDFTWDIYEYNIVEDSFRQIYGPDDSHEITPRYMTSGDIVFASTQQINNRALHQDTGHAGYSGMEEDRQEHALNLHVVNMDGQNLRQITYNVSHDFYPAVLPDGSILYTRWDNFTRNAMNLYRVNPDGTDNRLVYGMHSHDTGSGGSDFQFVKANVLPNGDVFVLARPMDSEAYGGDFITIDIDNYIDNTTPTARTNGSGPAQQSLTDSTVTTGSTYSTGGYYAEFHPLWDDTNRALASWSLCRVAQGELVLPCNSTNMNASGARPATPAYGIWMLDYEANTQTPVVAGRTGVVITDIVLGYERRAPLTFSDPQPYESGNCETPTFKLADATLGDLCASQEGVLHIRNVYDVDGLLSFPGENASADYATWSDPTQTAADDRPARFLRIVKAYLEPDRDDRQPDNQAFGRAGAQRMKQIIGYAPIEPDGSVKVRVPANVPLMVSITDAGGKRLTARHQNWITLRTGEVLECKGCHSRNSEEPHGRFDAQPDTTNPGQIRNSTYPGATSEILSPFTDSNPSNGEALNATMAEAKFSHIENNLSATASDILLLNQDPRFTFTWLDDGDPLNDLEAADFELESSDADRLAAAPWYSNLPIVNDVAYDYDLPTNNSCANWSYRCRIEINYPDHIQPLWEYVRSNLASDGDPATCVRCHSRVDDMNQAQVPAGQLELTSQVDIGIRMRSYEELFFADVAVEDDGMGTIVDCTNDVPRLDENGDPVLDDMGDPIIDTVICDATEGPYVSPNGAVASPRFFNLFETGGTHEDYLHPSELRLIAEWLDIGGQYYNDLFAAPEAN